MLTCWGEATCYVGTRGVGKGEGAGLRQRGFFFIPSMTRQVPVLYARGGRGCWIFIISFHRLGWLTAWTRVAMRAFEAVARGALTATPRLTATEESWEAMEKAIFFRGERTLLWRCRIQEKFIRLVRKVLKYSTRTVRVLWTDRPD